MVLNMSQMLVATADPLCFVVVAVLLLVRFSEGFPLCVLV
jgi:hypothetical protein